MNCPICKEKLEIVKDKGNRPYLICITCEKIICNFNRTDQCENCEMRYKCLVNDLPNPIWTKET